MPPRATKKRKVADIIGDDDDVHDHAPTVSGGVLVPHDSSDAPPAARAPPVDPTHTESKNADNFFGTKGTADPEKFVVGEWLTRVSIIKIISDGGDGVTIRNLQGREWWIEKKLLASESHSSTQARETRRVTRTELCDILSRTGDAVICFKFNKQPDVNKLVALLDGEEYKSCSTMKDKRAFVRNKLLLGEERTMHATLISRKPTMGRLEVCDVEVEGDSKKRLVDLRTIKEATVGGVTYLVK